MIAQKQVDVPQEGEHGASLVKEERMPIPSPGSIYSEEEERVLGVVCTALAHTLFIASLRAITAQSASLLASLEPVWGIVFGILLLRAIPTVSTLLGGALILCATLLPGIIPLGLSRLK